MTSPMKNHGPDKVLVTGANGHVGSMLVKELVEHGYQVRASVRDPNDPSKTAHLRQLGVEIVQADLFDPASLRAACEGMDGLFQVAAVYDLHPKSAAEAEKMIATGIEGMENALRAAASAGVGRVVLTSSMVTTAPVAKDAPDANEQSWVDDISIPYIREKSLGERRAWEVADELGLDMVSVLPAGVYGAGFKRSTPSTDIVEAIAKGAVRMGLPHVEVPFVDVHDVATVHRLAYEKGTRGNRYFADGGTTSLETMFKAVQKAFPRIKNPLMKMPGFMLGALPAMSAVLSKLGGYPHTYTRAMHNSWVGRDWRIDDSRTRAELGFDPKYDVERSAADTVAQLRAIGRIK